VEGVMRGRKEGEEIGLQKGAMQEKYETARKMKQKGFDAQTIADLTGLDKDEIEKLEDK
jgi:predicted transposase/invertase (TIGR01784 family)